MADSLSNLKERYFMDIVSYIGASGVLNLPQCCSDIVDVFMEKYHLKDQDIMDKLRIGTGNLLTLNELWHDENKENCTREEWVEACCWFIFKRPRLFKKRFGDWIRVIFDALDLDQDGYISEEQFAFFYQPTRRANDAAWISQAFQALGAGSTGKLSKKQYVKGFMRYYTDPEITYEDLPLY